MLVLNQLDALRASCRDRTIFERIHQLFRYTRISSGVMWCVWSSFANLSTLTTYFSSLRPTSIMFLRNFSIADEPVVNTQEELLLAFLLERVRGEVLVIPWLLPVTVPVGSPFLDVVVGNREEIESVLDKFSCSPPFRFARSVRTCR